HGRTSRLCHLTIVGGDREPPARTNGRCPYPPPCLPDDALALSAVLWGQPLALHAQRRVLSSISEPTGVVDPLGRLLGMVLRHGARCLRLCALPRRVFARRSDSIGHVRWLRL